MKPKVSIITPSYNQGKYLEETILSIINQRYTSIEYIVIDGGSTDNSLKIIKKYADHIGYWESKPDKGQANAINKGFDKASGDLICWINSDDILYPSFVEEMVELFNKNPKADFIYRDVDQGKNLTNKIPRKGKQTHFKQITKTFRLPVPQQGSMWRRKVLTEAGYLDEKWNVLLDREYFTRIFRYCRTLYQPGTVAFFRNHSHTKSIAEKHKWEKELLTYHKELFKENKYRLSSSLLKYHNHALINIYLMNYRSALEEGNITKAKSYLHKAKKTNKILFLKYFYCTQESEEFIKKINRLL